MKRILNKISVLTAAGAFFWLLGLNLTVWNLAAAIPENDYISSSRQYSPIKSGWDGWCKSLAARNDLVAADKDAFVQLRQPADWSLFTAGSMGIAFKRTSNGLRLASLYDLAVNKELSASNSLPLFSLKIRKAQKDYTLDAHAGWSSASVHTRIGEVLLRWTKPTETNWTGISIEVRMKRNAGDHSLRFEMDIENKNREISLVQVNFPQVSLCDPGNDNAVLFPRGPGEVQKGVFNRPFTYRGNYPGGWCSMPFFSVYEEQNGGLYCGWHDPWGSTKNFEIKSDPPTRSVHLKGEIPIADQGLPGNSFTLSGNAVWRLFRGDWYDAAQIYRDWAQKEAQWWPRSSQSNRRDTPQWMRDLPVWVMTGGTSEECVLKVKQFRRVLNLPVGFHWYNWHQVPFDNDYPHYFPTKPNFARGVADLQDNGVYAMPYINGRLWDTHDRGSQDFEFTQLALPAATKQPDGKPFLETYGSKETNGEPVRLAVMCPTTVLWQNRVKDIVLRLLSEVGTRGVYIDQIAAAAPALCQDKTHKHPLGGGHWWNEGYWAMLSQIRQAMPRDAMLTTECNGEPFIRWFDGYLTWHWQFDGQVPAFPAIYGGTIQMFGRAYRGGATKDLALQMKAGQQLVYGEQIGWFDPSVEKEQANFEFLRKIIQTRWDFRSYFHSGWMGRPLRLETAVPKVKADWQWSGEWWVTTDAILTGAWQKSNKRLLLLFVNVSNDTIETSFKLPGPDYGIRPGSVKLSLSQDGGALSTPQNRSNGAIEKLKLAPRSVLAYELTW